MKTYPRTRFTFLVDGAPQAAYVYNGLTPHDLAGNYHILHFPEDKVNTFTLDIGNASYGGTDLPLLESILFKWLEEEGVEPEPSIKVHITQHVSLAFAREELVTYLEIARIALADAETFDRCAEQMDISDSEMQRLREKLTLFMNPGSEIAPD